jgi:lipid-binding SYLF domain-containing protein
MNRPAVSLTSEILVTLGILFLMTAIGFSADDDKDKGQADIEKRIDNAAKVLDEIMATPDKGIPDKIMSDAKCIAVIPSMVKIAVGFGGSHGKGIATCRLDKGTWSTVAPVTITGGSWGLQLGGQAVDLIMIIMNDDGMHNLLSSKFKIESANCHCAPKCTTAMSFKRTMPVESQRAW